MNSAPPAMRSISSRRRSSSSSSIRVCVGSPGTFSTRKCVSATLAICGRCVIVSTWARSARRWQRGGDRVRGHAADAGVDLVEDERLAPGDGSERERDARELAARGGVGDRREREAGVRPDEERHLVGARSPRLALAKLDEELALAHAERGELLGDGIARSGSALASRAVRSSAASAFMRASASSHRALRRLDRIAARSGIPSSRSRSRGELQQLVVRGRCEATLEVGDRLEPLLDALERARLGVERRDEAVEIASPTSRSRTARSRSSSPLRAELGREALERRERALRARRERSGAFALVRGDRRGGGGRRLGELLDMPQPLAPREQLLLVRRSHALGRLDERLQLGEPRRDGIGVARRAPRSGVAPRRARARRARASRRRSTCAVPQNASSTSSWNAGRASRRCSNWPDIAISRSAAAATSSRATARPQAYARVRPSPKTRRAITSPASPSGRSSASAATLVLVEEALRHVELRLDVGLRSVGADGRTASARAPSSSPIACAKIVLPAPVSPVTAFRPGANASSASRMRTRFSIRRRRSTTAVSE